MSLFLFRSWIPLDRNTRAAFPCVDAPNGSQPNLTLQEEGGNRISGNFRTTWDFAKCDHCLAMASCSSKAATGEGMVHAIYTKPVRSVLHPVPWRGLAITALGSVALVAVSYLVAGNIVLRTRLLRNAISGSTLGFAFSGSATTLQLNYESAYTLTPGRVHVDGLSIRGRERALEWFISLDHADVDISLTALLHRMFRATRVQASGLMVRARLRLTREEATPDVVATLPPIPGLADPPLLDDSGPGPPPLTDAAYNLWSVDLEKVDVEHVREV